MENNNQNKAQNEKLIQKLRNIVEKYDISSKDLLHIGGGIADRADSGYYESNRHAAARRDPSRLTLGEATNLFKKIMDWNTSQTKEFILQEFPQNTLEWHHAGYYKGYMKKTYFLQACQIRWIANKLIDLLQ